MSQTHGEGYAHSFLAKPACPYGHGASPSPVVPEDDGSNFGPTFALFHGKNGVLPLPHLSKPAPTVLYPVEQPAPAPQQQANARPQQSCGTEARRTAPLFAAAPFASMSMSFGSNWFNFHHMFQQHMQQHRAQQYQSQQQRAPQQHSPNAPGSGGPGGATGPGSAPGSGVGSGAPPVEGPSFNGPNAGGPPPSGGNVNVPNLPKDLPKGHPDILPGAQPGGKCPLRRALGPFAGLIFNAKGHLACPEPIIKMRTALAATKPVRELRPQALPVKMLAVAFTTVALNVPCGMWREHTEKFSSQWFVAVHATIPFIAMLRKAVIMPKYAILLTICAAIAGQTMGAKFERKRRLAAAKDEIAGLAKASAVAALPQPRVLERLAAAAADAAAMPAAVALPVASVRLTAQRQPGGAASGAGGSSGSGSLTMWIEREEGAASALPKQVTPQAAALELTQREAEPKQPQQQLLQAKQAQQAQSQRERQQSPQSARERLQFRVRMRAGRRVTLVPGRGIGCGVPVGPVTAMLPAAMPVC